MIEKTKTYIILILIIGVLLSSFLVWGHQKTERKYQACLEKCQADYCDLKNFSLNKDVSCLGCRSGCKEKYGK